MPLDLSLKDTTSGVTGRDTGITFRISMSQGLSKSLPFEKARHFENKAIRLVVQIEASTLFQQ